MNDNKIHKLVESSIKNNKKSLFECAMPFSNPREEYIYNTAKRLVNVWFEFNTADMYKFDFECSLRNYLLLVKKA